MKAECTVSWPMELKRVERRTYQHVTWEIHLVGKGCFVCHLSLMLWIWCILSFPSQMIMMVTHNSYGASEASRIKELKKLWSNEVQEEHYTWRIIFWVISNDINNVFTKMTVLKKNKKSTWLNLILNIIDT